MPSMVALKVEMGSSSAWISRLVWSDCIKVPLSAFRHESRHILALDSRSLALFVVQDSGNRFIFNRKNTKIPGFHTHI